MNKPLLIDNVTDSFGVSRMKTAIGKSELQTMKEWYAYNTFVRKRYLRFLKRLPRSVITKDKGASFPSVLDIFTHVLDVHQAWLVGRYEAGRRTKLLEHLSFKDIVREEEEIDAYLSKLMQRLTPSDLEKPFEFSYPQGKRRRKGKVILGNLLWHLVEEELQHRGEINALLYQENINPPITDWLYWKKQASKYKELSEN